MKLEFRGYSKKIACDLNFGSFCVIISFCRCAGRFSLKKSTLPLPPVKSLQVSVEISLAEVIFNSVFGSYKRTSLIQELERWPG